MFPVAACRPKSPGNLETRLLGNVIGVGEKTFLVQNGDTLHIGKFVAIAGMIANIRVKSIGTGNAKVAIYADNTGEPGTLLGYSASTPILEGWNVISLASPVALSASNYWLACVCDTSGHTLRNTTGGTSRYVAMTYTDAFPDPPAGTTSGTFDYAIAGWGWAA